MPGSPLNKYETCRTIMTIIILLLLRCARAARIYTILSSCRAFIAGVDLPWDKSPHVENDRRRNGRGPRRRGVRTSSVTRYSKRGRREGLPFEERSRRGQDRGERKRKTREVLAAHNIFIFFKNNYESVCRFLFGGNTTAARILFFHYAVQAGTGWQWRAQRFR